MDSASKAQPLVTVLVATYNGVAFLEQQLDSIIEQSYTNLEIIIQDDASSDETCKIIKRYASRDSRIRFFQNKENLGIIQNFYDLIDKATGEYIAIADQDDIWKLEKIECLLNHIGNYSLIYTDSQLIDQSGNQIGKSLLKAIGHAPKSGKGLINLFTKNTVSGHACLFKKSIVPVVLQNCHAPYVENVMYDQLIAVVASLINGVTYYESPLTLHRIHGANNQNGSINKKSHLKLKKRRFRSGILRRKLQRVRLKIDTAKKRLEFTKNVFNQGLSAELQQFRPNQNIEATFNRCFFNRKMYRQLLNTDIDKESAKALSRGRLYYIFLCFF